MVLLSNENIACHFSQSHPGRGCTTMSSTAPRDHLLLAGVRVADFLEGSQKSMSEGRTALERRNSGSISSGNSFGKESL